MPHLLKYVTQNSKKKIQGKNAVEIYFNEPMYTYGYMLNFSVVSDTCAFLLSYFYWHLGLE